MNITLLHIDECPNWEQTGTRLRTALNAVGTNHDTVDYVLLHTPEEAAQYPFAGSPTVLIDGEDPFPSGGPITELACRVYHTENGLAGGPTIEQLTQAVRERL